MCCPPHLTARIRPFVSCGKTISAAKRTATAHLELRERLAGDRETQAEREGCTSRIWEVPEASWGGRTTEHVNERTR